MIDNGSGTMKAGLAGDDVPRCQTPTIVGRPTKQAASIVGLDHREVYVGEEAMQKRGVLNIESPIEQGVI